MMTRTKPRNQTRKKKSEADKIKAEVELAYLARKFRIAHPRGRKDNAGRWYPGAAEGGTPNVRSPSRAWPWSYMVACRTRKWCEQLPAATRKEDAKAARAAIRVGTIKRDENGKWA